MKKTLTLMWAVIITGTIFIALNFLKPENLSNKQAPPVNIADNLLIKEKSPVAKNDLTPKNYEQYLSLGDQYLKNSYPEKAVQNYQKANDLNPEDITSLIKLGTAYLENHAPKNARETFEKAAKLDPTNTEIQIGLIESHLDAREIDQAKELIWKLDEKNPEVKYYRAVISVLYKEFKIAEKTFSELNQISSTDKPEEASKIIEKSKIFLDAFTKYAYYKEGDENFLKVLLAKALIDNKEYEATIPLLFDVLNKKNNYRDAWILLGFAYLNSEHPLDAIDALKQAQALAPNHPQVLFFLGLAYFANDDLDRAIYFIEAADKAGFNPKEQINLKLADLYLLKKNFDQSAANYEKILSKNSDSIDLFSKAVWLNVDKINNPQNGLKLALAAIEAHPQNAISYNLAGWSYTALGDFEKAKELLIIAQNINPDFDGTNLNFGWLYEKQGLTLLAKEYYKKAFLLGQGNSIGNLAAIRFNKLSEQDLKEIQVNISAPTVSN